MKKFVCLVLASVLSTTTLAVVDKKATQLPLHPMPVHTTTTQNIVDALASRHYVPSRLDDSLSSRILDTYIEDLDPSKSYFLKSDIERFERYRYQLDDDLKRGNLNPAFDIFNTYHVRVISRFEKVLAMLDEGIELFDFTKDEQLLVNREEEPWATTEAELDELWRKRVKDAVLNLKLTDKEPEKIKELLVKRFTNRLSRSKQTNSEDVYQLYMNSFTKTYDPHTQYFSPRTSENFNINMSLSLEGIGAVLQLEDEYTKVVSLVPAGPADKGGILKPNDKIIAVGQGEEGEMVDVIGWRLDEVVQLIRGRKDTTVKLNIIPAADSDGIYKTISIVRNKVELEEQSARSEVIEIEQFGSVQKIGVIDIPTFYVDFKALQKGDRNFKSTTRDVKRLIRELQEDDIDGIVIDLRDNGGGSLQEAKMLTGLFIDRGPTVQIRSKSNRVDILDDRDISVVYDGPLAVLVNRLSASASEIFAGAIQDYERGIIIGSQTFGKGTVQSLLPLNRGQLKLTQAKFYRISGESTQEKGIIPDILYPSNYDPDAIGESTLEEPLPWDKITATNFRRKHMINHLVPELRSLHEERVADNPEFNYLKEAFAYRKARREEDYVSLNREERVREKEEREDFWLTLENKKRAALGQEVLASLDDLDAEDEPDMASVATPPQAEGSTGGAIVPDNAEGEEPVPGAEMAVSGTGVPAIAETEEEKEKAEEPDPYLVESGHILLDLISLEERTASETKQARGGS
ncbi:MAG: carboxy terminal-processing peptidase [Pseudomonadales bacterium]|nr:carboxy terminal-processing peptidase [Pseudomonadales bacterium]MBO6595545.1 carboxy terminal-processing peptidase [Pseudomonadales bacterium]MBO6658085.1 carboxy terminal-processing peptidase [Pseudomonadales bacterium]MBO6820897.1 carboxy terminal-processing peptidase [Pseudomonadales bacterium]